MREKINDQYFKKNYKIDKEDIVFYNVKDYPFKVYGLYNYKNEDVFKRLPDSVALNTNEGVSLLYKNTSGGRVRFVTDSSYVAIKSKMDYIANRSIMSLLCIAGFDLYVRQDGREIYYKSFRPPIDMTDGFEDVISFNDNTLREITIYFPLYNDVSELLIGISENSKLIEHDEYDSTLPMVYYGSSITQGASASRPGMSYEAIISRKFNADFINLGFAGSARGEDSIVEYMSTIKCSAFICDYDYNAPTPEHLAKTHEKLYLAVRNAQKDIPILLITRPTADYANIENIKRRNIVYDTYRRGIENGDTNLYFVDGFSLFGSDMSEDCFADGTHPNDLGFYRMSKIIGKTLEVAMKKNKVSKKDEENPLFYR